MFKELQQLQVNGSLTDTSLVGSTSKVSIHRAMLFADHVQPHPVWHQLDPGEGDGHMVVIVPDATDEDLESFVRKLYHPGEVFYTAVPNTPDVLLTVPSPALLTSSSLFLRLHFFLQLKQKTVQS